MNITIPDGSTPTKVLSWDAARKAVILQNNGSVSLYLGGSTVTADAAATGGYILAAGKELAISNGGGSDPASLELWAVHADASDQKITVLSF